jgi:hypothetical protein
MLVVGPNRGLSLPAALELGATRLCHIVIRERPHQVR